MIFDTDGIIMSCCSCCCCYYYCYCYCYCYYYYPFLCILSLFSCLKEAEIENFLFYFNMKIMVWRVLVFHAVFQLIISYCVTLQSASGAFQLLKEKVFPLLHQVPTPDLSVEMLTALSAIMLAQGQESIWNKTEQGTILYYLNGKTTYALRIRKVEVAI